MPQLLLVYRSLIKLRFARILTVFFLFLTSHLHATPSNVVNVYCWAYVLTPKIIQQFEKETGIKVNLDVYDTPEIMETKLFTGQSGYDVVVVTVWPYLPRQVEANIYQPLQKKLIPNWTKTDPDLLKRMEDADPQNKFALPFIWGTNGFAYNKKMILERYAKAPVNSLSMLFNPETVSKFSDCGVMLIDSPVDVFPAVLSYLKLDPTSGSSEDLKKATAALTQVRSSIKKFQPVPATESLTSKNYCLVQGFSGDLLLARDLGKNAGVDIEYVIPEEGASLWIDAFAIPKDAPHSHEAHAFINFMLRPDIIAQVTNAISIANSVPSSTSFMDKAIKTDPLIYPSKETLAKLYIDKTQSARYERLRLREWIRVKIGR